MAPIRRATYQSNLPLCVNQENLFIRRELTRLRRDVAQPSSAEPPPNVITTCLRLTGRVDVDVLEQALAGLILRHPGLRVSVFPNPFITAEERRGRLESFARTGVFTTGLFLQSVLEDVKLELRVIDVSAPDPAGEEDNIRAICEEEQKRHFDHLTPPLMRASLLRLGEHEHLLQVIVDHAVSDGWSAGILRKEFSALYARFCGAMPSPSNAASLSYADLAAWQHHMLRTSYFDEHIEYWHRQWARFGSARIAFTDLPFLRQTSQDSAPRFESELLVLDSEISDGIRESARCSRVNLFAFFLAAFAIVLRHYTGKVILALWGHFPNRVRPETQEMVGFLVHTHLLGLDLTADPSGPELMKQAYNVFLGALRHQELPLPHLWQVLGCHPRCPDANVLLDFNTIGSPSEQVMEVADRLTIRRGPAMGAPGPRLASVGVYVDDDREHMTIRSEYRATLFSQAGIRQMLADLQTVALELISDRGIRVSDFSFVGDRYAERRRVAGRMNEFVLLDSQLIPSGCRRPSDS